MEDSMLFADRYELRELAGRGGMAEVWRAEQRGAAGFARPVGLKRILPHLAAKQRFVQMFIEEARICAQLMHPNIIQIYDFGYDRGTYFLVMEWVEGLNLKRFTRAFSDRELSTPWPIVTAVGIEAAKALQAAHEREDHNGKAAPVIHRDVTPPNILLGVNGVVKLSDFGLARAMDRARVTDPDVVKGKMAYLAPELTRGVDASVVSDLYALGVSLWQALAGRKLFRGDTDAAVFLAARRADIPYLADFRRDVPQELVRIVHQALSYDPAHRQSTAAELRAQLAKLLRDTGETTDAKLLARAVNEARHELGLETPSQPPPPV